MKMKMNEYDKRRLLIAGLHVLPFMILYIISAIALQEVYLFKWMYDRWHLFIWLLAAILSYYRKYYESVSITVGCMAGISLGQFLGDFLRNRNMKLITDVMSPDEKAGLYTHYGFWIWLLTFLIFTFIGIIMGYFKRKSDTEGRSLIRKNRP